MGTDEPRRHRRRHRASESVPARQPAEPDELAEPAEPAEPASAPPARKRAGREPGERGLRDLIGAGRSQLGVSGALRGRDVARPTDEDLAEADRDVAIVRRHWKPHG